MVVLSEKKINPEYIEDSISIKIVDKKTIRAYAGDPNVEIIICSRMTARIVENLDFPNLKLLNLTSAGFDGVPLESFSMKKIPVANAGNIYSIPIAETVVNGMLNMAKRYRRNPNNHLPRIMRKYKYISELYDKKVIILGAGNIGTEVAKRLTGFGMEILGYDKFIVEKYPYKEILPTVEELKKELPDCSYVISTLPDNVETNKFINKDILNCMNKEAIFVNVGRNAVFNQEDLYKSLKKRQIGGAVLDMFELIPNPVTNKFRRRKNVIVIPGVAAISKETAVRLEKFLADNIKRIKHKEEPTNIINQELLNEFKGY